MKRSILRLKNRLRALIKWLLLVTPVRQIFRVLFMRPIWYFLYRSKRPNPDLPKVSIVMPIYNNVTMVGDAIRSARAQSWPNVEILITDDGSNDGSAELLDVFASTTPELKVIHQKNAGPGAARNASVAQIKDSKYLVFLDSDVSTQTNFPTKDPWRE